MLNFRRTLFPLILIFLLNYVGGTIGYMLIEGWSFIDAFYMTGITLTTVGFGETRPLSTNGRIFTVFLILVGAGSIAYSFSILGEYLLTSSVTERLRNRRMDRELKKLENHVIVCGYGRVGQSTAHTLRDSNREIAVLDLDKEKIEIAIADGFTGIVADGTKDAALSQAGLEKAWSLAVCTGDDSRNLFIVLSARALNPNLYIVARTTDVNNEKKMLRAGADRVVSPYQIGGKHMANVVIRPHVADFLDVVTLDGGIELWLEELVIQANSALVGQTVGNANIRHKIGATLVALLRPNEGTFMPNAQTVLYAKDELIVLGTREQLAELEDLTGIAPFTHYSPK